MTTTTRMNILNTIKSVLEGVSAIQEVQVNRNTLVDMDTISMPCAFVFSGAEVRITDSTYAVIGYETWDWTVSIEVWAQDTDMEELLGDIHTAMHNNEHLSTYAVTSFRTGVDHFVVDPTQLLAGMLLDYSIIYRHRKGVP